MERLGDPDLKVDNGTVEQLVCAELREWQALLRAAMTTKVGDWLELETKFSPAKVALLRKPLRLENDPAGVRPVGMCDAAAPRCAGCERAS